MTRHQHTRSGTIDWAQARERLQRAVAATDEPSLTGQRARALLDERAHRLAHIPEKPANDERIQFVSFSCGAERYAIESAVVVEICRGAELTPLPGAPPVVAGVMNHRGQVLAVFDLRVLTGQAFRRTEPFAVLVLGAAGPEFGIVADRAESLVQVATHDIHAVADVRNDIGAACVRGITTDAILIVDGRALLADARFFIEQPDA